MKSQQNDRSGDVPRIVAGSLLSSWRAFRRSLKPLPMDWAVRVMAVLLWLTHPPCRAEGITSGLREVESPAHLWIEGQEIVTSAGQTSTPQRILFAACDPYYVDVRELGPPCADAQTSCYRVRVPGFRGLLKATCSSTAPLRVEVRRIPYRPNGDAEERYDVWTPQLRHFFDPRYNSLAVLNQRATFEGFSTGTVATYWLTSGRRTFVFDQHGVLREKQAGAQPARRASVGGVLLLENYAWDPFFPRRLIHKRWEGESTLTQTTVWELNVVRKVSQPEELTAALPLWGELVVYDTTTQSTAVLSAASESRNVRQRLRLSPAD